MLNPSTMTYPEILDEIQSRRASMRAEGKRIFELSRILQDRVRRAGADKFSARYINYANACIRFVGGVEQAGQRTAACDRTVTTIEKEREQEAAEQAQLKVAKPQRPTTQGLTDLVTIFGQEMVDAAR